MPTATWELKATDRNVAAMLATIIDKQERLERGMKRTGRSSKESSDQMSSGLGAVVTRLASAALGYATISRAVSGVNQAYQVWLQNTREIQEETRRAVDEFAAFAALQEKGVKRERVERAFAAITEAGVSREERAAAFQTIQALQSAIQQKQPGMTQAEAFEQGLLAAKPTLMAPRLGVALEDAFEASVQGIMQGGLPGEMLRQLYVAGQESARDPAVLAKAASSMAFFEDKAFGASVAAALAGTFKNDLKIYLKQTGIGLSAVGGAQPWFIAQGLEQATRQDRLRALAEAGITTPEKMAQVAGVSEIRQAQGLAMAARGYAGIEAMAPVIRERAVPGLIAREVMGVEAELPTAQLARENAMLRSRFAAGRAMRPGAATLEQAELVIGNAFQRMEKQQALWVDLIDKEGQAGLGRAAWYTAAEMFKGRAPVQIWGEMLAAIQEVRTQLQRDNQQLYGAVQGQTQATRDTAAAIRERFNGNGGHRRQRATEGAGNLQGE